MSQTENEQQASQAKEQRWQLYSEHRKQAWDSITSSTDSFDKSLLAVSSAALGYSFTFVKDIVPLQDATHINFLHLSWFLFACCVVLTVFSFRLSVAAHNKYLDYLWKFYVENDANYFNKKSLYAKILTVCNWAAAGAFLAGIVTLVLFFYLNAGTNLKGVIPQWPEF